MSSSSQEYFGSHSQDALFEESLLALPFPLDEQSSPSPSPPPSPPPPPKADRPPSSHPQAVQLEPLSRPAFSPSPEPDEVIQLLAKGEKPKVTEDKAAAAASSAESSSVWSGLRREKTKAEIDEEKKAIAYGASEFGKMGSYMTSKRMKLQFQNAERAQSGGVKPQIFQNVAVYINGYVLPPLPELREMLLQHGGTYHAYLDKKSLVTHIIASKLTPQKARLRLSLPSLFNEFAKYKVITPDWVVQSIDAGKLLPWGHFKLTPATAPGSSQVPSQRAFSFGPNAPIARPSSLSTPKDATSSGLRGKKIAEDQEEDVYQTESSSGRGAKRRRLYEPRKIQQEAEETDEERGDRMHMDDLTAAFPETNASMHSTTPSTTARASLFLVPALPASALESRAIRKDPDAPAASTSKTAGRPFYALHPENQAATNFMKEEEWRKAHTSANTGFIKSYFEESRLHWLSTWKAELKTLVSKAQSTVEEAASSPNPSSQANSLSSSVLPKLISPSKISKSRERVVLHCDFDAFFVSVGRLGRQDLLGKPVVVCHSGKGAGAASTSEVASPSYEAREFGVKAGMSLGQARQLCPNVISIPYEFEKYKAVALQFYTILISWADILEAVSVDEALLEVTTRVRAHKPDEDDDELDRAKEVAEMIRDDVRKATQCEISIGAASNVLLARLASRKAKPAGSYHLRASEVPSFLAPLTVRDLWGFGRQQAGKIDSVFKTIVLGDLLKRRVGELQAVLGEGTGKKLWENARGIDSKQLQSTSERKTVSAEVNYGIRFKTDGEAETFVTALAAEAANRLRKEGVFGRALTLKIKTRAEGAPIEAPKFMGHGDCDSSSSTKAISGPGGTATADPAILGKVAVQLLRERMAPAFELRGIGVMITQLEDPRRAGKPLEAGQGRLSFAKKRPPPPPKFADSASVTASSASSDFPKPPIVASDLALTVATSGPSTPALVAASSPPPARPLVPAQPTIIPSTPIQARPSLSQVDPEVLAALPSSLRKELYPDWDGRDHRSASPSRRGGSAEAPAPALQPEAGPSSRRFESPTGKTSAKPTVDVSHIVRQLAPKSKTLVSPKRTVSNAFFVPQDGSNVVSRPSKRPARVGSDAEVVELAALLGYDLSALRALPPGMLREELSSMRAKKDRVMARQGKGRAVQPKVDTLLIRGREVARAREVAREQARRSNSVEDGDGGSELGDGPVSGGERGSSPYVAGSEVDEDEDGNEPEDDEDALIRVRRRLQDLTSAAASPFVARPSTLLCLKLNETTSPPLPFLLHHPNPFPTRPTPPLLAHSYATPPVLGKGTKPQTLPELRTIIDKWLRQDASTGPRVEGTKMMGNFVVECLTVKGEGNRERGEGVMRWWKGRIGERWEGQRGRAEGVVEREGAEEVGAKWWAAWNEVRGRVGREAMRGARWEV